MNNIQALRKEKHISQTYLSILLEVSKETISAYENGKHNPSTKSLIRLREIFQVSIDYILGLTEDRYPTAQRSDLSQDEQSLLHAYRQLDASGKSQIRAYLEGFLASRAYTIDKA